MKPPPASYPNSLNSIGDHIRKTHWDRGLLQRDVAEILGGHTTTVHGWGKKRNRPSLPFLPKIAAFLGYIPWYGSPQNPGEKIARARKWLGITQEELAKEIGVDPCTLARWEKRRGVTSGKAMARLETYFGQPRASRRREARGE